MVRAGRVRFLQCLVIKLNKSCQIDEPRLRQRSIHNIPHPLKHSRFIFVYQRLVSIQRVTVPPSPDLFIAGSIGVGCGHPREYTEYEQDEAEEAAVEHAESHWGPVDAFIFDQGVRVLLVGEGY